jgi:seryl-tRNA synthetase
MLDINLIRNNPEIVEKDLKKRKDEDSLKKLEILKEHDKDWKNIKHESEQLKNKRNVLSKEISELKKKGEDISQKLNEVSEIPKKIAILEEKEKQIKNNIDLILMSLPNIMHESVPFGESDEDNVEEEIFGKKLIYDFEIKSHVDLIEELDIVDLERASKISGARFWFLKGKLTELDFALQKYAIDFMVKKGYNLVHPPFMMNRKSYEGVTDLGDFEDVMYKIENEDLYLIATSEHPLIGMFYNEIIEDKSLPIKIAGISSCFRKEAGSHGKDTKGIFRGHQFNKIEQIIICKPEDSWKYHEELIRNAEEFWKSLGICFRRVNICTGDLGTVASKKYDLEAWYPKQNNYREVVSGSNCTDYQARRLKIRYRTNEGNKFVHTLNCTCVATSRALVAIIENFQNKDGSITIPKVLVPYMNGIEKIERLINN